MPTLTPAEKNQQEHYRDARFLNKYDDIWQAVGKCVLCDLNEKYIFFEENGVVMTISLFAYIDGHFMIVPRRHIRSPKELTGLEWDTIRKFTYIAKKLFKKVHNIKGMQLVQKDGAEAMSTVEHLHFHCIPFDDPDLCTWNYRQLKNTPLQNVALYKNARKEILKLDRKYVDQYQNSSCVQIVCDLLLINTNNEVLFQERTESTRLSPNYLTIPGGTVDDYYSSLEAELIREVKEEVNLVLKIEQLTLLASRLSDRKIIRNSKPLNATYTQNIHFLWNTYVLDNFKVPPGLKAGDDCQALVWVALNEVAAHERISPEVKQLISQFAAMNNTNMSNT